MHRPCGIEGVGDGGPPMESICSGDHTPSTPLHPINDGGLLPSSSGASRSDATSNCSGFSAAAAPADCCSIATYVSEWPLQAICSVTGCDSIKGFVVIC